MRNIFLSRPNWIAPKYKEGLDDFIEFLRNQNFTPRTLGTTDYPTNSPLDEVITLMKSCIGTIILGYPQIIVESGIIKNEPIRGPISLGTEWNHIETALAYSLNMPLLVIHDSSVSRGIFDRGTLNSFLYSADFENPSWFREKNIAGALTAWANRL
ncbi:hypothetical protein ACTQ33_01990 [Candidatus Avoscillospira sp. LCP25S3_F1]|uniref:hypothetical protein n=1 Tax=Candidatus Avoscillospira sp. LCP25S3_F1 TaxID=3438825 RepID=UPI003F8E4536